MNRKLSRFLLSAAAALMLLVAVPFATYAADAKIAFSDPSATVGDEFSVTMKFTSTSGDVLGNTSVYLTYDSDLIEFLSDKSSSNANGGSGTIIVTSGMEGKTEVATQLYFNALKPGNAKIQVITDNSEGYDSDGQSLNMVQIGSSSITISAKAGATYSDDATLASLRISPGTLDPEFQSDVDSYTASVSLDTERLTVSAVANDSGASVSVEGDSGLQEGENTVVCTVTAEDGTTKKTYTITVNKVEGGESAPEGSEETVPAEELEVLAELESSRNLTKIGVTALPAGVEAPAGLKESQITIGDTKVTGWTPVVSDGSTPEYVVFYGVTEEGAQGFYRYDMTDKTLQRYFQDSSSLIEGDGEYEDAVMLYNELREDYMRMRIIAIVAGVVAVILLIALIIGRNAASRKAAAREAREEMFDDAPARKVKARRESQKAAAGKISRKERYLMGEEEQEDDYMDEEDSGSRGSGQREPEIDLIPVSRPKTQSSDRAAEDEKKAEQEERILKDQLASSLAAAAKEDAAEDDDFEFLDLDEDE
ncbi:MAG: cadherin-like beta sandwich domain-containing protein [Clostridiales bacterium]|nr:cadherin-like beta sandwich domain-containing protein [Clostridiales bacterium]